MSLTQGQKTFAQVFAQETGLNPKVVGAWLLAEQSGSAAQFYQKKGYNNWLNIARTDSGDAKGSHGSTWSDPVKAARASAAWMKGQGPIASSYGKPASGIMHILDSAGQGPHRQIQAIARSGWASSGYNGGTTLSQLLGQADVPAAPVRGATMASTRGVRETAAEGVTGTKDVLNSAGYNDAVKQAQALKSVASLFSGKKPGDEALRESLDRAGSLPTPQEYTSKQVTTTPTGTYYTPTAPSGQYVHPIKSGTVGRTDMGVDISAKPGTPIRAIGDSKVLAIHPDWYAGQPYVELELQSGPKKGKVYYVAEQIAPQVKPGQFVRGGHAIGHVAWHGTGLELGWGRRGGRTEAQATTGYHEGQVTPAGEHFHDFLKGLH